MMADMLDISERAAFTTQALATMGGSPEWDRALSRYLACEALTFADEGFGDFAKAADRGADEAFDELSVRRYAPQWAAQRALAATPAPTLAAALFKVAMIKVADLFHDGEFEHDAMALVKADLARFAA